MKKAFLCTQVILKSFTAQIPLTFYNFVMPNITHAYLRFCFTILLPLKGQKIIYYRSMFLFIVKKVKIDVGMKISILVLQTNSFVTFVTNALVNEKCINMS